MVPPVPRSCRLTPDFLTLSPTTLCPIPVTSTATMAGLPAHFRWGSSAQAPTGLYGLGTERKRSH
jgi:hypothetical protein